ncbi:MFS transporter [Microbulbifer sp. THAF38]|uniref:MFS transporter n=1 Tax=Microbulbifer sp. THAF38 TaxID=2587856 RepID=UPI00126957B5|nr:MFS transporter [Microbulbifer sp. THAF38]QFT55507.1 Multidrug resistance protein stp [Microbulbifer sp. THAF38]
MQRLNKWTILLGSFPATFILGLDYTIVSIALPTIQQSLAATFIQTQWIINIFMLMLCILMASMGRLGDIVGSLKMLNIGWLLLALGSLLAGLSNDPLWLIVWRGLQGVAIAIIVPNNIALLSHSFVEKEAGFAMGWWMSILAIGFALGPVIGGFMCHFFSWRSIFYINIPFVLASAAIGLFVMKSPQNLDREKSYIDWRGMILLALSVGSLVLLVIEGPQIGWLSWPILVLLGVSVLSFWLLYRIEVKLEQPLIHFSYFKNPLFSACVLTNFSLLVFLISAFFLLPFYLHVVRQDTTVMSGLILLPITLVMALVSPVAGRMATSPRPAVPILIGVICILIAAIVMTQFSTDTNLVTLLLAFVPFGIAWGFVFSATAPIAIGALPANSAGIATGMLWGIQNIGAALGLAVTGTVFRLLEKHNLLLQIKQAGLETTKLFEKYINSMLMNPERVDYSAAGVSVQLHTQVVEMFDRSFAQAFQSVMWGLVVFTFLLLVAVALLLLKAQRSHAF